MTVKLLAHTPEPEKLIASAAKLCYSKSDIQTLLDGLTEEKVDAFIKRLADLGHESPIEHITFTFGIEGVSRALLAQITRHRIASYSVQSQRYVDMDQFHYVTPPIFESSPELQKRYDDLMAELQAEYDSFKDELIARVIDREYPNRLRSVIVDMYKDFDADTKDDNEEIDFMFKNWLGPKLERGEFFKRIILERFQDKFKSEYKTASKFALEDARFILPNACETKIIMTMNARSLLNFFKLRCCGRAQWEIRELAWEMLRCVREVAPLIFKNAGPACVRGDCPEGEMSCKKTFNDKI